ncbi:GNAT family N-acetyltransferase [Phenylobacterium sp.]|uniref:GNAT family N-acetyltransferase n=1 Tax=Phenylobacterium sp. TaxID=1871053 RepID=UPI0025E325DF|nr:GNAT family N-acetyltransferase [Phenylobacterium sp.]
MEIRLARESDLADLPRVELSAAEAFAGRDVPPRVFTDVTSPDEWRPYLATGTLWVAETGGRPEAFLGAHAEGGRLHIDEFAVARDHQGQGTGRRMLAVVADWARAHGFACLSLTTFRSLPFNGPFYAAAGFREWTPEAAPATIRQRLMYEANAGFKDRCAMRLEL